MTLLLLPLLLTLLAPSVRGQTYSPGICPTYQTSQHFDNSKIGKVTDQQGYTVVMYAGVELTRDRKCLRLRTLNRSKYVLSYIDSDENIISNEGPYSTEASGYTNPGFLELREGTSGVMGADIFGNTRLHPLLIGGDTDVYIACTSYGLYFSESILVMAPYNEDVTKVDTASIKKFLVETKVPLAEELRPIDQTCDVPGAVFVDPEANAAEAEEAAAAAAAAQTAAEEAQAAAEAAAAELEAINNRPSLGRFYVH